MNNLDLRSTDLKDITHGLLNVHVPNMEMVAREERWSKQAQVRLLRLTLPCHCGHRRLLVVKRALELACMDDKRELSETE